MNKVLGEILPMIEVARANRKIKGRLDEKQYGETSLSYLKMEYLQTLYDEEKKRKEILEGKAKTTTIGLTIAMTVMMGGASFNDIILDRWSFYAIHWVLFIMLGIATLFLLIAGLHSIKCFSNENTYYYVNPCSMGKETKEAKKDYDICIQKNREVNLVRNNLISGAYGCIRNALIVVFVCFILSILPV